MKKIVVLSLCIIAILAVPFGIGFITQQRSEELASHYRSNPTIHAIENTFQRGWFHSDVLSKLAVYLPDISDKNVDIVVHQSVRQGPVLWGDNRPLAFGFADVKTDIELPANIQNKLTQALGEIPTITLLTQLHYDGSQDSQLSIPEISHKDQGTHINMHPLQLQGYSDLPVQHLQATLNWQGMKISRADSKVNIGKSTSHTNAQKEGVIWVGDMDWSTDNIAFSDKQKTLHMEHININGETAIDTQQRISSSQSLHIEKIQNNGTEYGPGKYTVILNHIPLSVFEKLDKIQQHISTLPAEQREQAMKNMGFSMFSLLPDILAAEPEIKIHDASLTTPDGDIQGEVYFTITGLNRQDMMNFTKIKKHIRADMTIQVPWALVSNAKKANIENLLQKGWLLEEGDMLHSTLHMADGALTINQQTVP
ncbi:MAG: DUF945 family protein, partial [Mariprofundaceae bacterium]|nr:DUF945 family protein [Mariprofundaceae bacterium]